MRTRIAIIGGGASGVLVAAALEESARPDETLDVVIVERSAQVGPGLAYGAAADHHVLNSPAGRTSAFSSDPEHFVRWCREQGVACTPYSFMPRSLYGAYLRELAGSLERSTRATIRSERATAVDVSHDGAVAQVHLGDGRCLAADVVVLAVGNPPPVAQPIPDQRIVHDHYLADPWAPGALDQVTESDRVLILGTGLTMIDVATTLTRMRRGVRLVASSRSALLPFAHAPAPVSPGPGIPEGLTDLDDVVAEFRRQAEETERHGGDWRSVVDGMRPHVARLWRGFDAAAQRRFLAEFSREWEVRRHRMAPQVALEIDALRASGQLELLLLSQVDLAEYDVVINCTGARSVSSRGWSVLVDALLSGGLIRPDAHDLGLDLTADGVCIGADGMPTPWLRAVGPASKGTRWECGAIPEIRGDADTLVATRSRVLA